jgi:hypothetical protein
MCTAGHFQPAASHPFNPSIRNARDFLLIGRMSTRISAQRDCSVTLLPR